MTATSEASWNGNADTVSDDDTVTPLFEREDVPADPTFDFFGNDDADIVDGEIVDSPRSLKSDRPEPLDRSAKSGQPNIDEWMHFFSKVCIRLATDFYIDYAFRDIDEAELSDREIDRIKLTDVERDRMARPFAEYSNKSKFMKKHGRMIIASADSLDSVIQIGMWFSRVNRIRARHTAPGRKQRQQRQTPVRAAPVFRPSPPMPQEDMTDRSDEDVSSGPRPQPRGDHWRPDIRGTVFNPTGGG